MKPLVAVDANPAAREFRTGTEAFAAEVIERLPASAPDLRFVFYAGRPGDASIDLTVLPMRRLWSQLRLPIELWGRRPDLLFVPAHVVPFAAPGRCLTVVHDLAFERYPAAYASADRNYLKLTTRWAVKRCRLIIAVSAATARDLEQLYGVDPQRVRVVSPGGGEPPPLMSATEARRRTAALDVPEPFILHVGRVEPRKNQLTALAAVQRLPGLHLACAGPVHDRTMADRLAAAPLASVLGRVGRPDLEALYSRAAALCFPSLYEGFGFPVLEAFARGLPVVTARVSSLPEVGGEAALYVDDPLDAAGLARALEEAIGRRRVLAARGRRQAERFTWAMTATRVVAVIRELL